MRGVKSVPDPGVDVQLVVLKFRDDAAAVAVADGGCEGITTMIMKSFFFLFLIIWSRSGLEVFRL